MIVVFSVFGWFAGVSRGWVASLFLVVLGYSLVLVLPMNCLGC